MSSSEGNLSGEQIGPLVEAAQRGEIRAGRQQPKGRRAPRIREIDFTRPKKFSQEQQKRIERAHEAFCRAVAARMTAELRVPVELDLINLEQMTWSSAVTEIPSPSVFAALSTAPLDTRVLLSSELGLVMRLVECVLGGAGASSPLGRDLTEIEVALCRRIMGTLVDQLSSTWDELLGVQLSLLALESNLGNVQLAPVSEPSLAFTFEAKVDKSSATISLTVPHMSIASVVSRLTGASFGEGRHDAPAGAAMVAALAPVDVELRAEVASVELTADEILAIAPGDVVRLASPAAAGVTVYADQRPAYRARPGRNGRHRAVQVIERLDADPARPE